jgi:hypothetical protein
VNRYEDSADRLRAANPVPLGEAPTPDSPKALDLLERIMATGQERAPRRRRTRRWMLVVVPAAILAAAAAGYGLFRPVRHPLVVACFQSQSLQSTQALAPATGGDPQSACAPLWDPGGRFNPSGLASAPSLSACVLVTGGIGVFPRPPSDDVCPVLGLAPYLGEGSRDEDDALLKLQDGLSTEFVSRCVGRDDAISIAQQQLADSGLQGWSVRSDIPFTEQEPCASVAFDVPGQSITLVPVSNPASP